MINVDLTRPLEEALPLLSLEDVWRFYHEPSLHGREVGYQRMCEAAHGCLCTLAMCVHRFSHILQCSHTLDEA
jgi:hypothetical protein